MGYVKSIANELYANNIISNENIPFDISTIIDKPYKSSNTASNTILEHYMAR